MLNTHSSRKIERDMIAAINALINWSDQNTTVKFHLAEGSLQPASAVYLHGNLIAIYDHNTRELIPERSTFRQWPIITTASRLRALGVNASVKNGVAHIDGQPA